MKSTTMFATAVVIGVSGAAMAGGFVGLGVGTGSQLDDGASRFSESGRSNRIQIGYSLRIPSGRLALEGALTGYDVDKPGHLDLSGHTVWLAGRYNYALSDGFEVFARLGLQNTWVRDVNNYDGHGPVVSAGFEFRPALKLGIDPSIWVDVTYLHESLDHLDTHLDSSDHFATAGVTVGF